MSRRRSDTVLSWLAAPSFTPLLYAAMVAYLILFLTTGAHTIGSLDAELGRGGSARFGFTIAAVAPTLALTGWVLSTGRAWRRYWGNYLTLAADILLAVGLAVLGLIYVERGDMNVGYQLAVACALWSTAIFAVLVVVSDIWVIRTEREGIRAEIEGSDVGSE